MIEVGTRGHSRQNYVKKVHVRMHINRRIRVSAVDCGIGMYFF